MRTRGHVSLNLKRLFRPWSLAGFVVLVLVCGQSTNAMAYAEGSFQRTLHVTGPVNLDVSTGSGSIQIRTGGSNQVQVTGHIKTRDWLGGNGEEKVKQIQANPPIQQSGNIIRIGHIDDSELRRNVSISYELVVPGETQLHSQTGSGNQTVEGIRKSIEVGTGSGGLRITDIGDTVRADTGSGDVQIDRVKGNVREPDVEPDARSPQEPEGCGERDRDRPAQKSEPLHPQAAAPLENPPSTFMRARCHTSLDSDLPIPGRGRRDPCQAA